MSIRWGRIAVGGLLAEAIIIAGFLALLFATRLAGAPTIALPETPLDFANAIVSSFAVTMVAPMWVCRRVESSHVLHGVLVGVAAIVIFALLTRAWPEPFLYVLAHGLKLAGGATGGHLAKRKRLARFEYLSAVQGGARRRNHSARPVMAGGGARSETPDD